jgi:E3 ubiquitin-protein ligase TRIP12
LPEGVISLPTSTNALVKGSCQKKSSPSTSGKQEDILKISPREKLLGDQPELLQQFGLDLLPVLVQIYGSSVNGTIRHKCLSVIGKLMYFSSSEMIQSLIGDTNISRYAVYDIN